MSSGIEFKYGNYDFRPRPLFSIRSVPIKTPDGSGFGVMHTVSLEGDLLLTGTIGLASGILGVSAKIELLKDALSQDGRLLAISCDDNPIISGYPTIESYAFDKESDNMTRRASYNIEFQMPTLKRGQDTNPKISGVDPFNNSVKFPEYIESASESWDVEFADDRLGFDWQLLDASSTKEKFGYKLAVTHSVDVQARLTYTGELGGVGGTPQHNIPWQDARDYATGLLGFDSEFVTLTGALGLPGTPYFKTFDVFNHFRQTSINKTEGSVRVIETFIVTPSGTDSLPNNAIETFEISVAQNEGLASVNIAGTIEGLASIVYSGAAGQNGFYIDSHKFSAASGYYNIIKDRLFDRAKLAYNVVTGECFSRPLNAIVRNRSVGMNPLEGSISYDYEFDTTTSGCITGSCILSQNITIDDTLANDVFASQVVLGRAAGPILQDIGTITARTRSVNVELVTLPPTGCTTIAEIYAPVPTGAVEAFIAVISGDLEASYSQVFVSSQNQSWNFTIGRYSKSISFTYNNCSS